MRRLCCLLSVLCGWALLEPAHGENWPQFRGPRRDNISAETGLLRKWPASGPKVLWSTSVCEGYAAAAIHSGRVYVNDYDREASEWLVRCLTLNEGQELWRFKEKKRIRPNHGITRTVPAVDGKYVFALDPKCVFHCLDAKTGQQLWRKNLVREYQTKIPPWYNGQCPLIEEERVVIGVGGTALMIAFDKASGNEIWQTPNEAEWPLAHSSVMPAELAGVRQYVWCTLFGPLGVRAGDGKLLWHHDRKFNVAVAPSPLPVGDDRVFMTSGYDAGSVMIRVRRDGEDFKTETVFDLGSEEWNSETHTPILLDNHMFAVGRKKRGLFTCLDLDGQVVWNSGGQSSFDLGSFLLADGMFLVLEGKTGMLRLLEANTSEYRELDHAQVLSGHDVWGPMALSDGKLVLRDMAKMVCIEVGPAKQAGLDPPPAPPWKGGGLVGGDLMLAAYSGGSQPKLYYRKTRTIGGKGSRPGQFATALRGLAVDNEDRIYAVGDSKLIVFSRTGKVLQTWNTEKEGYSVAAAKDGRIYVGQAGQVRIFDNAGKLVDTWSSPDRLGLVTAIDFAGDSVIVADVAGRCLRRFDQRGKFRGDIGKNNRMRGFLVPNRCLDFAVDPDNVIHVANSGMHRVQRYSLEDKVLGHFGRFDGRDPAGFTGCCNPTNLALTRDGLIVVTEKANPRVKVYDKDGELLAVFGVGDFDLNCKNMDVVGDSRGRIYVIDTVRLRILVYEPLPPPASRPAGARSAGPAAVITRGRHGNEG